MRLVEKRASWIASADPSIFNSRQSSLVECSSALRSTAKRAYALVTDNQRRKNDNRQQQPPAGDEMGTGGEPYHCEEDEAGDEAKVSNKVVELFVMLDHQVASFQTSLVLLGRIHFAGAQALTSDD